VVGGPDDVGLGIAGEQDLGFALGVGSAPVAERQLKLPAPPRLGHEVTDPLRALQRNRRAAVAGNADHLRLASAELAIQLCHQMVATLLLVGCRSADPVAHLLAFVANLAPLLCRQVVVDQQNLGRGACEHLQHLQRGQFLVDQHHIVRRIGALRHAFRLAQHQQVVALGVQDLELHSEGLRGDRHQAGGQGPESPLSSIDGFARIEENDPWHRRLRRGGQAQCGAQRQEQGDHQGANQRG